MSDIFSENEKKSNINKSDLVDLTEDPTAGEVAGSRLKSFLNNFRIHKAPWKKEPFKFNPKVLFAILAIICVAFIVFSALNENVSRPLKNAASYVVVPAQGGINVLGSWLSKRIDELRSIQNLSDENDKLRKEIDELKFENNQLKQQNSEMDQLQRLVDLKNEYQDYDTIAAKIISKDGSKWFSSFTVNKGSADGVKKNMNVVAQGGLVGVVSDVGINYATVRTVINDDSSISAMFEFTSDLCFVNGNISTMDENMIDFTNTSITVDIAKGDAVLTSNVSSIYLPGLLIGYVKDYHTDGNELTQSGHITPVVDFDNLTEVLIINQLKETSD